MILAGKIVWPNLFKPRKVNETDVSANYSATLLIPKEDPDAHTVVSEFQSVIENSLGGTPPEPTYMPLKDGDKNRNEEFHGYWELRLKSGENYKPGVVDQNLEPILEPDKIQGGDEVRVDVKLVTYSNRMGTGIRASLNNVQWLSKGAKPIGTSRQRAEDVFTKISPKDKSDEDVAKSFLGG